MWSHTCKYSYRLLSRHFSAPIPWITLERGSPVIGVDLFPGNFSAFFGNQ